MTYLRTALLAAVVGISLPMHYQLVPFVARELAAYELASYNDGFRDGLAAGAGRNKPDGRIGVR